MKLLIADTQKETFRYTIPRYTYEKLTTREGCYKYELLTKYKQYHDINVDYNEKSITINGVKFNTFYLNGYVFKKSKGNNIGCYSFDELIKHIKESTQRKSPFYMSTFDVLHSISKKRNFIY